MPTATYAKSNHDAPHPSNGGLQSQHNIVKTAVLNSFHTKLADTLEHNTSSTALLPPPSIHLLGPALQNVSMSGNGPSADVGTSSGRASMNSSAASSTPSSPSLGPMGQNSGPPSETRTSTAPTPMRQNSGSTTPRTRPPPNSLQIPGLTRSRASPDGRIAQRDVASKLVIIMVGLPARGKSYITKKIQRYLSWQQHNTKIFNVGNRRRVAAGVSGPIPIPQKSPKSQNARLGMRTGSIGGKFDAPTEAAHILLNGNRPPSAAVEEEEADGEELTKVDSQTMPEPETMEQSAGFFDPSNTRASQIREQVALSTLDELLDYLLNQDGSVGILDATNSTVERRKLLFKHIKDREPKLGILFIESVCEDKNLLEANMRLKLSGPDYKDKDPEKSLADFKKRVAAYESAYVPLGDYEEEQHMQYIKMIDVGKKVIHFQLKGFLTGGISSYLTTFNLHPRQIWITRHGKSEDNARGKLGGNSDITPEGRAYGTVLYNFITTKRKEFAVQQKEKALKSSFPPLPGETTPPYPGNLGIEEERNFCVWTSMLKRSIQTAEDFDADDDYDVKNWEMLNELNAGDFEGLTYHEIETRHPTEYAKRAHDKLHYVYPGVGGEGYLQVISRLRDMVREIERITDDVLIIGHRSIARVLMAYFMNLDQSSITNLDVPLGMLYAIEPKPYGIEFHAYKYNEQAQWFDWLPKYEPQMETVKGN